VKSVAVIDKKMGDKKIRAEKKSDLSRTPSLHLSINPFLLMSTRLSVLFVLAFAAGCAHHPNAAVETYHVPYGAAYHIPLVSPGTKFAALPPAVQHTVRAETGGAEIDDIIRDTLEDQTVYRIYFINYGAFPPLYVAPDGSILSEDLTVAMGATQDRFGVLVGSTVALTLNDLPLKAVKTIQAQAPDAEIDTISRQARGDQQVYLITFKNKRHGEIVVSSEGVLLEDATVHVHSSSENPQRQTGPPTSK